MWRDDIVNMIKAHDAASLHLPQRRWVYDGCLKAYIRVTSRNLPVGHAKTIDIASVDVFASEKRKGHFKRFVEGVEELAREHGRVVYIENVMESFLVNFFKKRGYEELRDLAPPCLYRE